MFFGGVINGGASVSVQLPAVASLSNDDTIPCYAGIRFGSDGRIYRLDAAGSIWQWTGEVWLNDGAASGYYLVRTSTGDTLESDSGSLQQMNANLDYTVKATAAGLSNIKAGVVAFAISTDASGTPEVATRTYTFAALGEL